MATTKSITINCDEAKITPNGSFAVSVEIEGFSVDDLLRTIDEDDLIDWVKRNKYPEDLFSESELEKWAEGAGYIKEETKD